ncbi:MAG: hypothetical protein R6V12_20330 [Candidatus Hydrogenedentota bacterium]
MDSVRFEEEQKFHWLAFAVVYVVLLCALVAAGIAFLQAGETEKLRDAWWIPLLIALGLVVCLNVFHMRTTVTEDQVIVQFGRFFPMYRKRIPLANINSSRAVEYRPIRDAGGWGIRFGRFENKSCRFLNSRGSRGVLVETADLRYIIGSQVPEQLQRAIETVGSSSDVS